MKIFKNIHKIPYIEYITLGVILFISIYIRFEGIITKSFPYTYDIGRDLLVARDIATFTKFPLIGQTTGLPGFFYGPSWHYILGLIYIPLQGDPVLMTGFIAFTGVLMVFLAYILGRKIDGKYLGLTLAGLLGFSPVVVSLTSQIWNPTLIPIFWILTLITIYAFSKKKSSYILSFMLGVLLSLILDMEIVVGSLFLIGTAVFVLLAFRKLLQPRNLLAGACGFIFILLPRIFFDLRHQNILSKTLIEGIKSMFFGGHGQGVDIAMLKHKLEIIFELWSDTLVLKNSTIGMVLLIGVVAIVALFYKKSTKNIQLFIKFTSLVTLVTIVGVLFFGHDIWPHYLVALPLLFVLLVSLALTLIFKLKNFKIISIIVFLFLIIINLQPLEKIKNFGKPVWVGNAAVYRNQEEVVDYVYKNAGTEKFKYIVYTPPVHDYTYQYLFTWYGGKKYSNQPTMISPKLLFVIVEPDPQFPLRVTEWLKSRENDGKIIKEEKMKSGIIIQTRTLTPDSK